MVTELKALELKDILAADLRKPPIQIWAGEEQIVLATACLDCLGKGQFDHPAYDPEHPDIECDACNGSGYRVTDQGRAIQRLMALK